MPRARRRTCNLITTGHLGKCGERTDPARRGGCIDGVSGLPQIAQPSATFPRSIRLPRSAESVRSSRGAAVRGITGTLLVLLAVGYFASSAEWSTSHGAGAGTVRLEDGWRRTAQGWEQRSDWMAPASMQPEPFTRYIHPWTIAALQVLVSLLALQVACPAGRKTQRVRPRHADATPSDSPHHATA